MKVFLCASALVAAVIATPIPAASIGEHQLPAPDVQLDEIKFEKTGFRAAEFSGKNHTDSILEKQMRHLQKLREQAERDAARIEKLKRLQRDS